MAEQVQYKCPCCGGAITFDTSAQTLKCPFCGTEFDIPTLAAYDQDILNDLKEDVMSWDTAAGSEWQDSEAANIRAYTCKSCGGSIIGDAEMAATSCPYCGNPVVLPAQFSGDLKPDFVIPFKLNKEAAKEGLRQHISGKKLLPRIFKDENHIDEIKGIYVPFWLFDTDAQASCRYNATRTNSWMEGDFQVTETDHFSVMRAGKLSFHNVAIDGSTKMDDDLMESIEPFDFSEAVPFSMPYLAGYMADRYDVPQDGCIDRANARIKRSTEQVFRSTVRGYGSVVPVSTNIHLMNARTKYALYPVWLLNTTYKGQRYTFAMNGQTGKFVGDLPMDKGLYWKNFGIMTGVIGAAVFGLTYLLQMI